MFFQEIINNLNLFWSSQGCLIMQPYDTEKGAGTMSPHTFLRAIGPKKWSVAYAEPCRRPTDGRFGENPNRAQHYYQYQVIIKPSPDHIQETYLSSLEKLGVITKNHDIRFVEDNWESPTLGAWGVGWEVWLDGMEVTQFTYFQQCGGIDCHPIPIEITYGLERIAMFLQNKESIWDLNWDENTTYKDIWLDFEKDQCDFNFRGIILKLPDQKDSLKCKFLYTASQSIFRLIFIYPRISNFSSKISNLFNILSSICDRNNTSCIQQIKTMTTF